jgi:transposase
MQILASWIKKLSETSLFIHREYIKTLIHHNIYIHIIKIEKSEGFNNKIKVRKRKTYGYGHFNLFLQKTMYRMSRSI